MSYLNNSVQPPSYGVQDPYNNINWQGNWLAGMREGEGTALAKMPYNLFQQYNKIATDGVYGLGGMSQIMSQSAKTSALQRRALSRGVTNSLARRVGPRSAGAVQSAVFNQVQAPQMAGEAEYHRNLLTQNMASKMQGLQGMEGIMKFMQERYGNKWWEKAKKQKGGVLGFMKTALDIASMIRGPHQPNSMGANAMSGGYGGGTGGGYSGTSSNFAGNNWLFQNYNPVLGM